MHKSVESCINEDQYLTMVGYSGGGTEPKLGLGPAVHPNAPPPFISATSHSGPVCYFCPSCGWLEQCLLGRGLLLRGRRRPQSYRIPQYRRIPRGRWWQPTVRYAFYGRRHCPAATAIALRTDLWSVVTALLQCGSERVGPFEDQHRARAYHGVLQRHPCGQPPVQLRCVSCTTTPHQVLRSRCIRPLLLLRRHRPRPRPVEAQ